MPWAQVVLKTDQRYHLICSECRKDMIINPNRRNTLICSHGCNSGKPFCNVSDIPELINRDCCKTVDSHKAIDDIKHQLHPQD